MSSFRQWKIFNKVFTPEYKNNYAKSYGTNTFTISDIYIGSSKTNSFPFLKHETKVYEKDGKWVFKFYVDGEILKAMTYDPKTKETKSQKYSLNNLEDHLKDIKESLGVNTDNKTMNLIDSKIENSRENHLRFCPIDNKGLE